MKFEHLNVPTHWRNYWTRYPEGHTILEALISWVSQVDAMVDDQNKLHDNVEQFQNEINANVEQFRNEIDDFIGRFDERLQTEVSNTLSEWQSSGFLDVIISEALQWQLDDYVATNEQDKVIINQELQSNENKISTEHFVNKKNGGYSWWTYPQVSRPTGLETDKTYFTFVNREKQTVIASLNNLTGEYEDFPLMTGHTADEHNTGAIQVDNGGRILVAYALHGDEQAIRVRRSVHPASLREFEDPINVPTSGTATYAQFYKTTDGKYYLFYRTDLTQWCYRKSSDGVNWGAETIFIKAPVQYYLRAVPDGTYIRLYLYGHPYASTDKSIRYGTLLADGTITTFGGVQLSDGVTGLPLNPTAFGVLTDNNDGKIRLFDGTSKAAGVAYATFKNNDASEYFVSYYESGTVTTGKVCDGGKSYDPNYYFGGMFFDPENNKRVYVAREKNGAWFVEVYETIDKKNWFRTSLIDSSSNKVLYRPFVADRGGGSVIYNKGVYNSYIDYVSFVNIK